MLPFLSILADSLDDEDRFDLLIYCTRRAGEEQNKLYCMTRNEQEIAQKANVLHVQGFTRLADYLLSFEPGDSSKPNVTNATAGESMHNYGLAFDAVPLVGGKALWDDKEFYNEYGRLSTTAGFEWAGHWVTFPEMPHSQLPGYPPDAIRKQLMPYYNPEVAP